MRKENKGIQTGKEEATLSVFAKDMTVYIKYLENYTWELLLLTNFFSNVVGYKISSKIQ